MDIPRNADRLTLIYTATLSRFGSGPCIPWYTYTQAYGGAGATAPEHAAAKRGHHPFFFLSEQEYISSYALLVRGKGGFVRTLRTPLGYVPVLSMSGLSSKMCKWSVIFATLFSAFLKQSSARSATTIIVAGPVQQNLQLQCTHGGKTARAFFRLLLLSRSCPFKRREW